MTETMATTRRLMISHDDDYDDTNHLCYNHNNDNDGSNNHNKDE